MNDYVYLYYLWNNITEKVTCTDDHEFFCKWFSNLDHRTVAKTQTDTVTVLTFALGMNYDVLAPEPIIFETMIVKDGLTYLDYQERYATHREALRGHKKAVKQFT